MSANEPTITGHFVTRPSSSDCSRHPHTGYPCPPQVFPQFPKPESTPWAKLEMTPARVREIIREELDTFTLEIEEEELTDLIKKVTRQEIKNYESEVVLCDDDIEKAVIAAVNSGIITIVREEIRSALSKLSRLITQV